MSLYRITYVRCNLCDKLHGNGDSSPTAARRKARKDGWKRLPGSPSQGGDFCPRCSEAPSLKGLLE